MCRTNKNCVERKRQNMKELKRNLKGGNIMSLNDREFQKVYKKALEQVSLKIGAEMIAFHKGHYMASAFLKRVSPNGEDKFVYISTGDMRDRLWWEDILVRRVEDEEDYIGNINHFTHIDNLKEKLNQMLE